jgi:hypothetical protein
MDWKKADQRHDPAAIPGQIYRQIQTLIQARQCVRELHAGTPAEIIRTGNPHVLAYARSYPGSPFVGLANFSDQYQTISSHPVEELGLWPLVKNLRWGLENAARWDLNRDGNRLTLAPYDSLWLVKG